MRKEDRIGARTVCECGSARINKIRINGNKKKTKEMKYKTKQGKKNTFLPSVVLPVLPRSNGCNTIYGPNECMV